MELGFLAWPIASLSLVGASASLQRPFGRHSALTPACGRQHSEMMISIMAAVPG